MYIFDVIIAELASHFKTSEFAFPGLNLIGRRYYGGHLCICPCVRSFIHSDLSAATLYTVFIRPFYNSLKRIDWPVRASEQLLIGYFIRVY